MVSKVLLALFYHRLHRLVDHFHQLAIGNQRHKAGRAVVASAHVIALDEDVRHTRSVGHLHTKAPRKYLPP
eukprot:4543009-Pyramimonas_sp.AAC.1